MADNMKSNFESLLKGLDGIITSKTVVGEPIKYDDTIIIPLVEVSFGMGTGAYGNGNAGGMNGKVVPNSVLIIQNGSSKVISIKNQDGLSKVLDMVPDFVNKFLDKNENKGDQSEAKESLDDIFVEE